MALCTVGALAWLVRATPLVRDRVVVALNERFASQVALGSLDIGLFPSPHVAGTGLTLRHNARTDVPPLITILGFRASGGLYNLLATPLRLRNVTLDHLAVRLPPGSLRAGDVLENHTQASRSQALPTTSMVVDEIVSRSATLEIASSRPGRLPRVFEIHDLVMHGFGLPEGAAFHAGLTNPVPRGRIETSGTFGPWEPEQPRLTPVRGEYAFKDARLESIKGIGGTLSSVGTYRGVLQRIEVEGQTEIPDFSIDVAGQPVPLTTRFAAIVDGTNGDTQLERVEARLGGSTILARGAVVRTEEVRGRRVTLDVRIEDGRIEDLLRLAVKAAMAPLTGRVDVETAFLLSAGPARVIDRLQLDGRFSLASARFTNLDVQKRLNALSRRAQGDDSGASDGPSVVSNVAGRFALKERVLSFEELTFGVPGATVQLTGTYDLGTEQIAMAGNLLLDASLPDTLSGFRSLLARAAQPFFRRPGGGSKLPIRISGTRSKPSFGLDVRRAFWFG